MARKKQKEQDSPGIVVLYTSLMILLLAFFILLNSISKTEEARVEAVFESLVGAFGFQPGGTSPMSSVVSMGHMARAPINPLDQDYIALRGLVKTEGLSDMIRLLRSDTMKTTVLPSALLFEPDSDRLSPRGIKFLDQVAEIIKGRGYPFSINGHTDDAPAQRFDQKDNWTISADRALAVLRHLAGKGVEIGRMAAFGFAGYHPDVPNDSIQHRRMNNRVELVFDARDRSKYGLPERNYERKLDFRGFSFDLMGELPEKEK